MLNTFIPVVRPEVGGALQQEVTRKDEVSYIKEQLKRLEEDNPVISFFISKLAKESKDPKTVAMCGILVFRLLESQAEANLMNLEICLE